MPEHESKNTSPSITPLILISILSFIVLMIPLGFYVNEFKKLGLSSSQEHWAQFGDYIGGTTNPALTFITFIALLWTIHIQRKELSLTRTELEKAANAAQTQASHMEREAKKRDIYRIIENLDKETAWLIKNSQIIVNSTLEDNIRDYVTKGNLLEAYAKKGTHGDIRIQRLADHLLKLESAIQTYDEESKYKNPDVFMKYYCEKYSDAVEFLVAHNYDRNDRLKHSYINQFLNL